ncbi:hypothetical protein A0O36_02738 [Piscirickettsiaceae bacterium NZ-RLO1]|nr:hypothetical protein A0O36_02738 [Piscirickettsiaceae bacterium NZ-RLO1]
MINFSGRHFKKDLIMMAIRWYVAYTILSQFEIYR